jgi:hypothetical protein
VTVFLLFPKSRVLKWGLLFDGLGVGQWSFCGRSEQSSNLLLAVASTVILGFGTHDHIFVLSKTIYIF